MIMEELKTFAEVPEILKNPRLFSLYPEAICRMVENLLWNALEAETDTREVEVTVAAENTTLPPGNSESLKTGDYIKISIADNGKGIPEELGDKLFQPNFTTKSSGMGMGLAIVKSIVENAGGTIHYETEQGMGTTFIVQLPLYKKPNTS